MLAPSSWVRPGSAGRYRSVVMGCSPSIKARVSTITAGSMNIGSGAFTLASNGDTHISVLDVDVLQPDDITVQDDLVVISSGSINFSPLGGGGTL